MSLTYGFYNSIGGDRKYNALQMSSIFDGIIKDGVYMTIGDALAVKQSSGMTVTIGEGRAWFNHTWTLNDSLYPITLDASDVLLNRIDAIVLEVNANTTVRANSFKIVKGTPATNPAKPTMIKGELLNQHPLAYITVGKGVASITQANIENAIGTSDCPYVTGVLKGMDIDKLVAQWGAQWAEWLSSNTDAWKAFMSDNTNEWKSFMAKNKNEWSALINGNTSEFETWFEHMKDQLSEDAAGNLQLQVDNLNNAALGGDFVLKGSPVSVEYMGENRIASITAYGENAQGGTTEAPVALTGVDSVFVGGNNLLPKAVRTETTGGITFTPNPDGSILVSGTATTNVGYSYAHFERALLGRTVCLSGGSTQAQVLINERLSSGAFVRNVLVDRGQGISGTLTKQKEDNILYATIQVLAGTTVNTTIYPMLNLGESPLPYEPYWSRIIPLPIPRPLRRVGDVKDKCITRVKRIYDKRIVLDGAEDWKMGSAVGDGAPYIFCDLLNDHYQAFPIISSRFPSTNILASNKNQGIGCWDRSLYLRYDSLFTNVEELKTYLSAHPLTVYYQSTAYDGTNGLDVCLMKYQTGFVELDGTEGIEYQSAYNRFAYTLPSTAVNDSGFCSHYKKLMTSAPGEDKYIVIRPEAVYFYDSQYTNADAFNAYLAAQKAAGTPVQVAYQLATPEVYATDPVDFDNAAGPLTVLTGGELEAAFKSADKVVESRIDFVEDTLNEQGQAIAEKAPISHSSDKSTYGLGSGSQFGHVKLSDATASGSNAGQGIAATPSAVNQVHAKANAAQSTANAAMPKAGGTFTGTVAAKTENIAGAYIRNISVQNSASQLQYTNFIIMVRK